MHRWWLAAAALVVVVTAVVVVLALRDDRPGTPVATPPTASTAPTPSTTPPTASPTPTTAPVPAVPAALRGADVEVIPTEQHVVALTFDAGANAPGLPRILAHARARGRPRDVLPDRRLGRRPTPTAWPRSGPAGHRVGNHSMTHPHLTELDPAGLRDEVLGAQQALRAAGVDPRPLFRFPFGDRDAATIAAVNDLGYVAVRWTVDSLGWQGTAGGMSAQAVADRVLAALRPGEIVLMHVGSNPDDGTTFDADALPSVIDRIRAAGYGFVTLDALLGA